jgi:fluoride exporter
VTGVYVALGAMFGAPLRWWVDQFIQSRWSPVFPWGTFVVNVGGSFLLGAVVASAAPHSTLILLVGVGFCGALTTFSSYAWESLQLTADGSRLFAALNVFGTLAACLLAAGVGYQAFG